MSTSFVGLCLCLVLVSSAIGVAQNPDTSKPPAQYYDMRSQCLSDLEGVHEKFVALAEAVPSEKLGWRPSPDSRSFAEVFLHVAGERYVILGLMGVAVPPEFEPMISQKSTSEFERSAPRDRARILEELRKSWEFTEVTLKNESNSDFSKPLSQPARQKQNGDLVFLLVADQHEHLGQAVAYARENGIIPPWSGVAPRPAAQRKEPQK